MDPYLLSYKALSMFVFTLIVFLNYSKLLFQLIFVITKCIFLSFLFLKNKLMAHCYNPLYHTCQYYGIHKKNKLK